MHFWGLEDDRKDSTAPHITFKLQLGGHRQCGLAICTFHLGFSLGISDWTHTATRAIEMAAQDDGWAFLGAVGTYLRQLDPAFDVRSYGYKQLSPLVKSRSQLFETRVPFAYRRWP